MNTVEEKLRRGFGLVERAESDSDLLGVALLAIHSALEDHLRGVLSNHAGVNIEERQRLIRRELSWAALTELAQRHLSLSDEQRKLVVEAQEVRRGFIHGNSFRWRIGDVLRYGRFVEAFCGAEGLLDEVLIERRAERRARPQPAAPPPPEPEPARWGWNLLRLAIIVAVFGAIGVGLFAVYRWVDDTLRTFGEPPPSAAVATATTTDSLPIAAPTAVVRTGRIVNLGAGPGWLHENPSFASPTMPPRLSEGDNVTVLNEPTVEADGTTWIYVEASGYKGWSPINNVQVDP